MRTVVKTKETGIKVFEKVYSDEFVYDKLEETYTEDKQVDYDCKYLEILLNGVMVQYFEVHCKNQVELEVCSDSPLFKLHFEIEGLLSYSPLKHPEVRVENGCYNFYYLPEDKAVLYNEKVTRKTFELRFSEAYLKNLLGVNFNYIWKGLSKALKNESFYILWKTDRRITPEISELIEKIISCDYPEVIKKTYLEAKVTELLMMVLADYNQSLLKDNCLGKLLSVEDFVIAKKIENIINSRLANPPTISELAVLVGTNSTKLKKDFKEVYSKSVFQFITEQRMKKAVTLLKEQGLNVTQTAYEIGYKNPQHFTVAFKKYFGFLPKEINK